jgi:2',3'-cyclic-nucleotide 2'-phosphodiesterase (5'-nucleotidase family)
MVSTSNVFAEYYDCGCPNNPLGGLARKAHFINTQMINMSKQDPILLDAGNMLFDSNEVNPDKLPLKDKKYKAENLVRAMELLDHDVINVGSNDFKGGLDFLTDVTSRTTIKFVSANLYDKNEELLFLPYHIVSSKGLDIGIIGLSEATKHNSVINKDFVSEGNKNIDKIIDSVDIVVILIDISDDNTIDLASAFPRADYIFLSGVKYFTEPKIQQRQDGPFIYAGGIQGKRLSIVNLYLKDPKTSITDASPSFSRMNYISNSLKRYKSKDSSKTLNEIYAGEPGMLQLIDNYKKESKELEEFLQEEFKNNNFNLFTIIELKKAMQEDKKVADFVKKVAANADFPFEEDGHQH